MCKPLRELLLSFLSSKARDWSLTLVNPCTRTKREVLPQPLTLLRLHICDPGAQGLFNHHHHTNCLRSIDLTHGNLPRSTPSAYWWEGLVRISSSRCHVRSNDTKGSEVDLICEAKWVLIFTTLYHAEWSLCYGPKPCFPSQATHIFIIHKYFHLPVF